MSLCTHLTRRLAMTAATGVLVTAAAVTPAVADGGGDSGGDGRQGFSSRGDFDSRDDWDNWGDQRVYRGVVSADSLRLRSAPTRGSRPIRTVYRGDFVSIICKTGGQSVQGNPLWYLLADGTWAWGSARFIDNIGSAPRWC